jgi:very-short-patch-repair endonuclease
MDQLLALAGTQCGLFTRTQAYRCGLTAETLRYRRQAGFFEALTKDVFRVCGAASSWEQAVLAACLAGGDDCVASHRTAAALWGFDGHAPGVIEVTVPRKRRYRSDAATVHTSLDLVGSDCTVVDLIPVTTPARTLIDLGAVARWQRVEDGLDSAERERLTEQAVVARRHAQVRKQGRRGVGPMAVVLNGRPAMNPHSVLERKFMRLLADAELPTPNCQFQVRLRDGRTVRIDAAHDEFLLGWELEGHAFHSTRRQRAYDNARQSALHELGWRIDKFTYEQVTREGAAVVRTVRAALHARSCDAKRG